MIFQAILQNDGLSQAVKAYFNGFYTISGSDGKYRTDCFIP